MFNFENVEQIAYLGPQASFTETAADYFCQKFKINAYERPFETIKEVVKFVENNPDTLGVLPMENSIEGTNRETLDALINAKNPNIKIVAVEPSSSPVLKEGVAGPHKIQGIGAGFVPDTLNTKIYDEIIGVSNEDAFEYARLIGKKEGFLVGISSGAAAYAAISLAKKEENKGKNIVVLFPDTGERYLSTALFE